MSDILRLQAKLDAARRKFATEDKCKPLISWAINITDEISAEGLPCPTAGTDGVSIRWHPQYVEETAQQDLFLTLFHELLHVSLFHTDGRGKNLTDKYGAEIANYAMDYAVNAIIRKAGYMLPNGWLYKLHYADMSTEEIVELLFNEKQQQQQQRANDAQKQSGKGGGHQLMGEATPEKIKQAGELADKICSASSVLEAMQNTLEAEGQGSNSMGSALQKARDERHKTIEWREELSEFTGAVRSVDFRKTYSKMCRHPLKEVIKRGKKREGKPLIGIILDTSGSMYNDLPKILAELEVMSDDGFSFDVVCCDGDLYGPYHYEAHDFDYSSLPLKGGGGSNMVPAFEMMKEMCPDAEAIVFVTDGSIEWPDDKLMQSLPPCLVAVTRQYELRKVPKGLFEKTIIMK